MNVYRLCKESYSGLDGEGAFKYGGRWNSRGIYALYTSENPSLALLEILVHLDKDLIPEDFVLLKLSIPDELSFVSLDDVPETEEQTKAIGNKILKDKKIIGFRVPSIIVPEQFNFILNPKHVEFMGIICSREKFKFDKRFFS